MRQPQYKFYATAIDAFQYYLNSDRDEAFKEFIDRLNRVPFTSEAAEKGTAFNDLVDVMTNAGVIETENETIKFRGFEFKSAVVNDFVSRLYGATPQYKCSGLLETSKGLVELYGYIDEVKHDEVIDIKTTAKYEFPKFLHNYQHIIYPYCLHQEGIPLSRFKYLVTDFNHVYEEDYIFSGRDTTRLRYICEMLIDFIEINKHLITDKKLFAQEEQLFEAA